MSTTTVERVQWYTGLVGIGLVPLAFSTLTFDVFTVVQATALWVTVVVVAAMALARWVSGDRPLRLVPLARPAVVFVTVMALATVVSRATTVSFFGTYGRLGGLSTLWAVVFLAWTVATGALGRNDRQRQLLTTMASSAALGACYLWFQQLGFDQVAWLEPWSAAPRHPPGTLGNSNFSGAHLALGTVAATWLALHRAPGVRPGSSRLRVLWPAVVVLAGSGVGVSQSRGAALALGAGLLVVAGSTIGDRPRRRLLLGLGSLVVVGALVLAVFVSRNDPPELLDAGTLGSRIDLWQVAFEGAVDRPLFGGGPDLYLLTFAEHAGPELAGVVADEPHNVLLDHLDGAGLLGAVAWCAVWVTAGVGHVRRRRRGPGTAFAAIGVAYLVQSVVSIDVLALQLWGWVALAGLAATMATPAEPSDGDDRRSVRVPVLAATAVLGALALFVVSRPVAADHQHRRGIEAANAGESARAVAHFRSAVDTHPYEVTYRRRLALQLAIDANRAPPGSLERRERLNEAMAEFDRASDLYPGDPGLDRVRGVLSEVSQQ